MILTLVPLHFETTDRPRSCGRKEKTMPKLQAYKPQPNEEKITRVKLHDHGSGIVTVIAVDKDGNEVTKGNLFQLLPNGKIQRMRYVNPNLGFVLDGEGRIKFEDEE